MSVLQLHVYVLLFSSVLCGFLQVHLQFCQFVRINRKVKLPLNGDYNAHYSGSETKLTIMIWSWYLFITCFSLSTTNNWYKINTSYHFFFFSEAVRCYESATDIFTDMVRLIMHTADILSCYPCRSIHAPWVARDKNYCSAYTL